MPSLNLEVTRGDPFYYEIPFIDQYGAPVNLSGWTLQADFKRSFSDRAAFFSLTQDNDGLAFRNADPTSGILCLSTDSDQFDDLDLSVPPRNGERVPFKFLVGDLKMIPPNGIALVPAGGSRLALLLKVRAGVTA